MSDHINILLRRALTVEGNSAVVVVEVRYKYSPITDESRVIRGGVVYDAAATNRLGQPGAYHAQARADRVEAAVGQIRARYGEDVPVQNNLPDWALDRPLLIATVPDGAAAARAVVAAAEGARK